MTQYASDVTFTVGGTPLIALDRFAHGLDATILGKQESRNPLGSCLLSSIASASRRL